MNYNSPYPMLSDNKLFLLITSFKDKGEILNIIAEYFVDRKIPEKIASYIVNVSVENMSAKTFKSHLKILSCVPRKTLSSFLPGLFSAYFHALLSLHKVRNSLGKKKHEPIPEDEIAKAMTLVLDCTPELDPISQSKIYDFFLFK